ncbi:hypothetical protein MUP01_04930 [Candidatus Bathyarchaeota archaeon]|nr:hypothetical protein [Candidatus Bathyarchaeota archaeon]
MKRALSTFMFVLLLVSMLTLAFRIQLQGLNRARADASHDIALVHESITQWDNTYGGTANDLAFVLIETGDGGYALAGNTYSYGAGDRDCWFVKTDSAGNVLWNKTYGGTNEDYAYALVQTGDGGYALAGITNSYGAGSWDFWLVKTDSAGNAQWNKTYGGINYDEAYALIQTGDGGYALTGYTNCYGAGLADFWLVKTDSAGNAQWNRTYGGTSIDEARDLVQTVDGGYALAGHTGSYGAGGYDFWLVKTDSAGNAQWNKTYGGIDWDYAHALVVTSDGGYALVGDTGSFGAGGYDFWLVKTDSLGITQWNKTFGGTNTDWACDLVLTSDGGYALAGYTGSFGAGGGDFWLVKTDGSGNASWNKTYGGTSIDEARDLVQTSDGGYALAGYTYSYGAGQSDFWLVKTGASVNAQWNKTYGGTGAEVAHSVVQTGDGGYAMAGLTTPGSFAGTDAWLVKTDSAGNALWNKTYGGAQEDVLFSIVCLGDDGFALAGYTRSYGDPDHYDLWLMRTDSNGNMLWNRTYGGPTYDVAYSLIQTSDGGFALAGSSWGDAWLVKTDSSGNAQWNRTYGGIYSDSANSIVQTPDGGYTLAGYERPYPDGWMDFWLIRTDMTGNMLWNRTYGWAGRDEIAYSMVRTADGGYMLAGETTSSYGAEDSDAWLVRTDSTGNMLWNRTYGGGREHAYAIVQAADGGYVFTGYTRSFGAGATDSWLVKISPTGDLQWSKTYGGAEIDGGASVVQTSDGGYALAGHTMSFGAGSLDFWLIKIGPSTGVDRQTVCPGQSVGITISVKNEGTATETFNVTAYYNATAIETKTVPNLASGNVTTLTFTWSITDEPLGSYIISAYAHPVADEIDIADNNCTVGVVRVMLPWDDWNHYHDYAEIVNTLLYLNGTYPDNVDVFSIGKSWLNKDIYCIKLTNESSTHPKPKLLFIGYHHARELISAELALYFAVEAATNFGTNETITRMLNYSEIYIVPALNVDGFNAVKQNEWQRKNVHPFDEDNDTRLDEDPPEDTNGDGYIAALVSGTPPWDPTSTIIGWEGVDNDNDGLSGEDWIGGVDINRNYGYQWNATCFSGSPDPSAEDYRGPAPFSEPETQAMRDLALSNDFKYAISFHSGSESIGYPWGYTADPTPDDNIFRQIASNLSALVGDPWYGQSASGMYTMSGSWDDWMYANRSTLALTCEIYTNNSAWQYEPGPEPDTWWMKGIFQAFNPDTSQIETVVQTWLPTFTYVADRAIAEAYDVAAISLAAPKTVIAQGSSLNFNTTVANRGEFTETFNVTVSANSTSVGSLNVTLSSGNSTNLVFTWNTTAFSKGNYTISIYVQPIPGEARISDNSLTDGLITVARVGDITGPSGWPDDKVDVRDVAKVSRLFGVNYPDPRYDPNCDLVYDGKIDVKDVALVARHFGDH